MAGVEVLGHEEVDEALEHRDFDVLAAPCALALEQRGEYGMRRHLAGDLVRGDRGHVPRRAALAATKVGRPCKGLNDVVIGRAAGVRAGFAEAKQRQINQPGVAAAELRTGNAQGAKFLRADIVDEDVGGIDQRQQVRASRLGLEVENDAAFIAVRAKEQRGHARFARRSGEPRAVAVQRLDLDDVGAVVGKHLRRRGSEHDGGDVDDADARQGMVGGFARHLSMLATSAAVK